MKIWKLLTVLGFFGLLFFTTSCGGDDDTVVNSFTTFNIVSPANGSTIDLATQSTLKIDVELQASLELHQIMMNIHEQGTQDTAWHAHSHGEGSDPWTGLVAPQDEVETSKFTAGKTYVFEIRACGEHQCAGETIETKTSTFTVQ